MSTLYVSEQGASIHKKGKRLLIRKGQTLLDDIPLIKLDKVVVLGKGVSITTPAMFTLTYHGIDVVYMTQRGRFVSRLIGKEHNNSRLRFQQAIFIANPRACLPLARAMITGKIINQRALVRRHSHEALHREMRLEMMEHSLRQVESAGDLDALRGMEGNAAKHYFGLYKHLIKKPRKGRWGFYDRNYYPPRDPINSLLSFGYTLLLNEVVAACQQIGMDAYLGCFHAINYGRPSLALDLMEEFRPVITDSLVLDLVNHGRIQPGDFRIVEPEKQHRSGVRGVHLSTQARNEFFLAFEKRINQKVQYQVSGQRLTYRQILRKQAEQAARIFQEKQQNYQAYTWR
jgi:CRISP-associated protein Cas1